MAVYLRTTVRVYCDGGTHQGLEFTVSGERPMTEARAFVRNAGWSIARDGRTFCREHRP